MLFWFQIPSMMNIELKKYDPSQEPIFPSELQVSIALPMEMYFTNPQRACEMNFNEYHCITHVPEKS